MEFDLRFSASICGQRSLTFCPDIQEARTEGGRIERPRGCDRPRLRLSKPTHYLSGNLPVSGGRGIRCQSPGSSGPTLASRWRSRKMTDVSRIFVLVEH